LRVGEGVVRFGVVVAAAADGGKAELVTGRGGGLRWAGSGGSAGTTCRRRAAWLERTPKYRRMVLDLLNAQHRSTEFEHERKGLVGDKAQAENVSIRALPDRRFPWR
jgi:hypothetical protein